MKSILIAFACLLLAQSAFGQWAAVLAGSTPVVSGGTWYSSGDGTYNAGTSLANNTVTRGAKITVGQTGNITKIRFDMSFIGAAQNVKVALYTDAATPVLIDVGATVAVSTTGIYEVPIAPQAVTNGEQVEVWYLSTNSNVQVRHNTAITTGLQANTTYASFPNATLTVGFTNVPTIAVGVYVE